MPDTMTPKSYQNLAERLAPNKRLLWTAIALSISSGALLALLHPTYLTIVLFIVCFMTLSICWGLLSLIGMLRKGEIQSGIFGVMNALFWNSWFLSCVTIVPYGIWTGMTGT